MGFSFVQPVRNKIAAPAKVKYLITGGTLGD